MLRFAFPLFWALLTLLLPNEFGNWNHNKLLVEQENAVLGNILDKMILVQKQNLWADSVLKTMSEDQKIGQLFIFDVYPTQTEFHFKQVDEAIEKYHVGGVLFFQGSPTKVATLANRFQNLAKIPLFSSLDAENGLAMRLDSTFVFPKNMTLGAIQNDSLIAAFAQEIAFQCRRIGVNMNFAPVADVNSNPKNPIIGNRSFGENPYRVARHVITFSKHLLRNRVMPVAKHFPGHGDTDTDSHFALPTLLHDRARLDSVELLPFRLAIKDSLPAIMVGHLYVPILDEQVNRPASLSKKVLDFLQKDLNFEGLIITDALNMKGAGIKAEGDIELEAVLAGNDLLLQPKHMKAAFEKIRKALQERKLKPEELDRRVRKILKHKYLIGITDKSKTFVPLQNVVKDLQNPRAQILRQTLYKQAVTVVRNPHNLLPFVDLTNKNFASIVIGTAKDNDFQKTLSKYAFFEHHALPKNAPENECSRLADRLWKKEVVIIGIHALQDKEHANRYGISPQISQMIEKLNGLTKVVVVVFGNPYSLKYVEKADYLVAAYEDNATVQQAVPQVLFGASINNSRFPVNASPILKEGLGSNIRFLNRLEYNFIPESVGMRSEVLGRIDSLANYAIKHGATPSLSVLVARKGKVVFQRNYGHYTYDKKKELEENAVFDLASVTKVVASTLGMMHLYDKGEIDLDNKISEYLPDLKGTNKENLTLKNILIHQAGLVQSAPYWWRTLEKGDLNPKYYQRNCSDSFGVQVGENLYVRTDIEENIWEWLKASELRKTGKISDGVYGYLYADVGFYMLKRLIEKQVGKTMPVFLEEIFYKPLGLETMTYNPLKKMEAERIVPTEIEKKLRKKEVRGYVHDPDAAILGGVGGHAGVFSTINDLAILLQMTLQNGKYGGKDYFKPETVAFFAHNRVNAYNRRGLGWDKPIKGYGGPSSGLCSMQTYGHTGYTGVSVWVDPAYDLVFILCSNRTYPNGGVNSKLITLGTRNLIQATVYEAMGAGKVIPNLEMMRK